MAIADMLYPQSMTQDLTEQDRKMLLNRALMSMGARMLSGAGQNQPTGAGLGSALMTGVGSMDNMMSTLMQNQLRKQQMGMQREQLDLSKQRLSLTKEMDEWRRQEAERTKGASYELDTSGGVPVLVVRDKDGNIVKAQPVTNPYAMMGLFDDMPAAGDDTQAPPPSPREGGSGGFLSALSGWSPVPSLATPRGVSPMPGPPPARMTLGGPGMGRQDIMTLMNPQTAPAQSALPAYFYSLPEGGQRMIVEQKKDQLTEQDKKILTGMGLM